MFMLVPSYKTVITMTIIYTGFKNKLKQVVV